MISKFDIGWQVLRVSLKKLPSYIDKLNAVFEYLLAHRNKADKERVLNYLEGLAMAYRGEDRKAILGIRQGLLGTEVSEETPTNQDLSGYDQQTLLRVAADLMVRNKKWLLKGYRHEEQITFIRKILEHLGAISKLAELDKQIAFSHTVPNTHKFFF